MRVVFECREYPRGAARRSPRGANGWSRRAKRDFSHCLQANFGLVMSVMRELERRLRSAEKLIGSLALLTVMGRVLRLLRQAAEVVNGQMVVRKKLSHQAIASRIGCTREAVSHALRHLRRRGRVEVRDGSLILRDEPLPALR